MKLLAVFTALIVFMLATVEAQETIKAVSDVENALVPGKNPNRKQIDPSKLHERFTFDTGIAYAGKTSHERQKLDILYFKDTTTPRPAIVIIHGGGLMVGERWWGHHLMAMYAAQGYITLSIDYRLAHDAPYPAQINDAKLAIRWLRANAKRYGVDPERMGCIGGSAGAYLSALVVLTDASDGLEGEGFLDQSSRVQAAVIMSGSFDRRIEALKRRYGEKSPKGRKSNGGRALILEHDPIKRAALIQNWRENGESELLAEADWQATIDYPDRAAKASPVTFLTPDDPPFLVFHSEKEQSGIRHVLWFAEDIKAMGRKDKTIILPGKLHGFFISELPEFKQASSAFFATHLKGAKN